MWGILEHQSALMESFADETDIALFKVSNAAVREFRGAARGPFREIRFLHQ
jgi:hypothetical protein